MKTFFSIFIFCIASNYINAQVFDPNTWVTHYPNGTMYIPNVSPTGSGPNPPVVVGPDGEMVDCDSNRERCKELLEQASDDADTGGPDTGSTPGGGSDGGETDGSEGDGDTAGSEDGKETSQFYSPEIKASIKAYKKKLKAKYGVWSELNGKWIYASSPQEWTKLILGSWSKNKKKIKKR